MFDSVLDAISGTPWAILPEKMALIERALLARIDGAAPVTAAELAEYGRRFGPAAFTEDDDERPGGRRTSAGPADKPKQDVRGGVAVVPLRGTITPRPSAFSSGGTSAKQFAERVQLAARDSAVRGILLDVDSPGGSVHGIEEAAAVVAAAKAAKPVWASVDPTAASAAYWLASQADRVYVAPGGQVGSIGVLRVHIDRSKATEKDGLTVTELSTAKYKSEGTPYAPLPPDARTEFLRVANQYHQRFASAVAAGRRVDVAKVERDFGQGRMMIDSDAIAAGMADGVATFAEVLDTMQTKGRASAAAVSTAAAGITLAKLRRAV